jgi:hypothetical protein
MVVVMKITWSTGAISSMAISLKSCDPVIRNQPCSTTKAKNVGSSLDRYHYSCGND